MSSQAVTSDVVVQRVCSQDLRKMQNNHEGLCKAKAREKLEPANRVRRLGQSLGYGGVNI